MDNIAGFSSGFVIAVLACAAGRHLQSHPVLSFLFLILPSFVLVGLVHAAPYGYLGVGGLFGIVFFAAACIDKCKDAAAEDEGPVIIKFPSPEDVESDE